MVVSEHVGFDFCGCSLLAVFVVEPDSVTIRNLNAFGGVQLHVVLLQRRSVVIGIFIDVLVGVNSANLTLAVLMNENIDRSASGRVVLMEDESRQRIITAVKKRVSG